MSNIGFLMHLTNSDLSENERSAIIEEFNKEKYNSVRIIVEENLEKCKSKFEYSLMFSDLNTVSKQLANYRALLCMDNLIMDYL